MWSPESIYKDPVLRFYKLCKKWLKEIHKNPKAIEESENFKTSPPMKKVLKDVSVRLGFEKEFSFGKY